MIIVVNLWRGFYFRREGIDIFWIFVKCFISIILLNYLVLLWGGYYIVLFYRLGNYGLERLGNFFVVIWRIYYWVGFWF